MSNAAIVNAIISNPGQPIELDPERHGIIFYYCVTVANEFQLSAQITHDDKYTAELVLSGFGVRITDTFDEYLPARDALIVWLEQAKGKVIERLQARIDEASNLIERVKGIEVQLLPEATNER